MTIDRGGRRATVAIVDLQSYCSKAVRKIATTVSDHHKHVLVAQIASRVTLFIPYQRSLAMARQEDRRKFSDCE